MTFLTWTLTAVALGIAGAIAAAGAYTEAAARPTSRSHGHRADRTQAH